MEGTGPPVQPPGPEQPTPGLGADQASLPGTRSCWALLLISLACLALGIAIGVLASLSVTPRRFHLPTTTDLDELCRFDEGVQARRWTHIVLHHSAGPSGNAQAFDRLHRKERRWKHGLGYNFVIGNGTLSGDGEIEVGHRWRRQMHGAHCKADTMNQRGIGICFVGDFESGTGPTQAQIHAGLALVTYLAKRFDIEPKHILGHRDVDGAETLCPGQTFPIALFRSALRTGRRPDQQP
jgi:hypothetical protein